MVSATSRSSCAGPIFPATAATWASTNRGRLDRQRWGRVDGGLGDRPRPPGRHPSGVDLRPQPGEAVAQLEGVADELLRRHRGDAQDGAELGDTELRHQRRTRSGDGLLVLTPRDRERRCGVDRLGWVQVGPPGGEVELRPRRQRLQQTGPSGSRRAGLRGRGRLPRPPAPLSSISIMRSSLGKGSDSGSGAISTGCCNEPLVEGLARSLPFEGLAGSGVQLQGDWSHSAIGEVTQV